MSQWRASTMPDPDATLSDGYVGDLLIGYAIEDRYRVERLLGEGGMGRVYEVTDLVLSRRLVLKTLLPELSEDPALAQRFLREARAAASVASPNIVGVVGFGTLADGRCYYVMEHVEGPTLEATLNEASGPMEPRRALEIARGLARAIAAAHRSGVIHRDLKPDNVVLTVRSGRADFPRLLDFGLARITTDDARLTVGGELVGTPHYMAPEQCTEAPIDGRADVYAIGVLLYEMLTLVLPFDADSFAEVLRLKVTTEPIPPSAIVATVPREVEALVLRAMARDPAQRFPTGDALVDALDALLGPEPSGLARADVSGDEPTLFLAPPAVPSPPPPPPAIPAAAPAPRPAARRRSLLPLLAGAVFFVALVVVCTGAAALGWALAHPHALPALAE